MTLIPIMKRIGRLCLTALVGFFAISLFGVILLKWVDLPTSSIMLQHRFKAMGSAKVPPLKYEWVDYEDMPPSIKMAVIAAEDQAFARHIGFDVEAIVRAVHYNKGHRRTRGASTISQQVAKNVFLWQERNLLRKGLEVYFTVLIEGVWGKKRILEVYLNVAQMGKNLFGIKAASIAYFKKEPKKLSKEQAALLAAILPSPVRYSAINPSPYVRNRQHWILQQMNQLGQDFYLKQL